MNLVIRNPKLNSTGVLSVVMLSILMLSSLAAAHSQTPVRKSWNFKTEGGAVRIDLLSNQWNVLELNYDGDPHPSVAQEAGFLHEVLKEMSATGVDPHHLSSLCMRGFVEPEVQRSLAIAALHSPDWRNFTKIPGGAERVVEDLLNELKLYDGFNSSLKEYGYAVKVSGVEKVSGSNCLQLELGDALCGPQHNRSVPTGANFCLSFQKIREVQK
jgi:hypothetical protein